VVVGARFADALFNCSVRWVLGWLNTAASRPVEAMSASNCRDCARPR
jgi:hypothetical protein